MTDLKRRRNELAQEIMPLLLLGVALVSSNSYFSITSQEARSLDTAALPLRTAFTAFRSGMNHNLPPPLYDVLMHFWLRLTGGSFEYLRIPAILFFLVGLLLLGRAAHRLGGPHSGVAVVWLGALWPLSFLHGRLAGVDSFLFFLVAGLTLAHAGILEKRTKARRAAFLIFGVALLWTNYFGWIVLGCLALHHSWRHRSGETTTRLRVIAENGLVFCVAFLPLVSTWSRAVSGAMSVRMGVRATITNIAVHIYSLFVSEAVGPWHWPLSIPASIAIVGCILLAFKSMPRVVKFIFVASAILIVMMGLPGVMGSGRLFLVAPWVLLPVGVAVAAKTPTWQRGSLAAALLVISGVGWYGIYVRQFYIEPQFIEPWLLVAGEEAIDIQSGATLISNSPPLFFFLTYLLRTPNDGAEWKFAGSLPETVLSPGVKSAEQWLADSPAKRQFEPRMVWIRGIGDPQTYRQMDAVAAELDRTCGERSTRLMMRDPGYTWKQKFLPEVNSSLWRIEVRKYDCTPATSPQTYPPPAR